MSTLDVYVLLAPFLGIGAMFLVGGAVDRREVASWVRKAGAHLSGGGGMSHPTYSADRRTHLKIIVVALVAGIAVASLGIAARVNDNVARFQDQLVEKLKNTRIF